MKDYRRQSKLHLIFTAMHIQPTLHLLIPFHLKWNMRPINYFRRFKRSLEEMALLSKQEMHNSIAHNIQIISLVFVSIHFQVDAWFLFDSLSNVKVASCRCLTAKKVAVFSNKIVELQNIFHQYVPGMSMHAVKSEYSLYFNRNFNRSTTIRYNSSPIYICMHTKGLHILHNCSNVSCGNCNLAEPVPR